MPSPVLDQKPPEPAILERIGKVASEWAWVELLLAEMLAHFCRADHGSMYVITQNVSSATINGWLRILTEIHVKDMAAKETILAMLKEIDDAREERNLIVHGVWKTHDTPGFAWVQTMRWERSEVFKTELWSVPDLDAAIENIVGCQTMLGNLGLKLGFLKPQP